MYLPDEGNLFTAKPEPLVDLLRGIERHDVALPNFQRPWVWEPPMVRDLIVSVAHRYPAGSLLTMPVSTAGFALRPFEGSGDELKKPPGLMILDGQQRLTSLYQALFRAEGVEYKGRQYHFYLDVPTLLSDEDGIHEGRPLFDDALFFVLQTKAGQKIRYEGLVAKATVTTHEQEVEAGALPLRLAFDASGLERWKDDYLTRGCADDFKRYKELQARWNAVVAPWLERVRTYPFPVVELRADMPLSAICHIFEKVNSTGKPLDVFDLCTAIQWAQGFHLNEEWARTQAQLEKKMTMQPLVGTYFLQGIALLDSLSRKRERKAAGVAVSCRKDDLMRLPAATIKKWWKPLIEGYRQAAKFMTNQGILGERILPHVTLIVPLSVVFADQIVRHGDAHVGSCWGKVERWYWCSVFTQRYSSNTETNAAVDVEQVLAWIDGGEIPDAVRTFSFRADALQEITSIRNAIYKGVLCLLARGGALDFGGGGKLSHDLFYETRQDHHHVYPLDALSGLGVSDPRVDTIANKTLISAAVNRSIGGRKPSDYVTRWRTKIGAREFDAILASHLIDPEALASDDWERHLHARRARLRELIESVCGHVQPFADGDASREIELE